MNATTNARRQRQLGEIASLVVAGSHERAQGLAMIHVAEFPEDTGVLARITDNPPAAQEAS